MRQGMIQFLWEATEGARSKGIEYLGSLIFVPSLINLWFILLIKVIQTDAEAEAPILWPPDAKNWLIGKDPDAGKDWRQEEKGTTEDEMIG